MKFRWEIINWLIGYYKYKTYLEIGVKDGVCFNRVNCETKTGMDIKPLIVNERVYKMSSDFFFIGPCGRETFDIIFIDGDHHEEQVDKDIQSSLKCLRPNGIIVMHDCNPEEAIHATPERGENRPEDYDRAKWWCGTAYKSFLKLRRADPGLTMFVIDIDTGCGIIQKGRQNLLDIPENPTWEEFDLKRASWLDLISIEEFQRRFA